MNRLLLSFFLLFNFLFGCCLGRAEVTQPVTDVRTIFVQVSKKIDPSVVNIFTTSKMSSLFKSGGDNQIDIWREFFGNFFSDQQGNSLNTPKVTSLGSGFVIEASNTGGLILTNNHVIEGADEIKIKFTDSPDEKETIAEVLGVDSDIDIALLKVKTKRRLQAAILGDSDRLEVGEWIAAFGNPFGLGHTLSHGVVSAKERALPGGFGKYLQVDAPINPGNSGGPLVNLNSEVVGINNAIDARAQGIGFAIPINSLKSVLEQLKTKGRVDRGFIGINVDDLRPEIAKGLKLDENLRAPIVTNVLSGEPAERAGVLVYDVIMEVNGRAVRTSADLVAAIASVPIGQSVKVKLLRSGREKVVEVAVVRRPDLKSIERPKKMIEKSRKMR